MKLQQSLLNASANDSHNHNAKPGSSQWHYVFDQIIAYIAIALAVVGVLGNSLIVYKFGYVKRKRRSQYETLLLALGIADLICVAVTPIVFAYGMMTNFQSWQLGVVGCKLVLTVLPMNITITQGMLIFISFERYQAVKRPLMIWRSKGYRACVWLVFCLFLAMALASPYAYALDIVHNQKYSTKTCTSRGDRNDFVLAFTAINLTRDIATVIIFAITGYLTTKILLRNNRCVALENNRGRFKDARKASLLRVRRMLLTIIFVFSFSTIPLDAFQFGLYTSFRILKNIDVEAYLVVRSINTVLFLLQASNSAANIFIYARMHKDFRGMTKKLSERFSRKTSLGISNYNYEMRTITDIEMVGFGKIDNPCKAYDMKETESSCK